MVGKIVPFLSCLMLAGCAAVPSVRLAEATAKDARSSAPRLEIDPDVVAALPPGARIEILSGPADSIVGTVLHASADGVALLNCEQTHRDQSDPTYLHRHIPVHWTSIRLMVSVRILSPPDDDYVPPRLDIDTNDRIVAVTDERTNDEKDSGGTP